MGEDYDPNTLYDYHAVYKKPTNMVFEDKINKMTPKGNFLNQV